MFEPINYIDVDRKNSLPVADFTNRYLTTKTPVVFGDLTHRWAAFRKWNLDFFQTTLGEKKVEAYSHKLVVNRGEAQRPVMRLSAKDYFDLLTHDEDGLHVRGLDLLEINPFLENDFLYPRFGLDFEKKSPSLHIGGRGASEQMHYRPDLAETFLCNFGGKQSVLLVPPEQAKYTYEPPLSFESLSTVDFTERGKKRNPAITKLTAYFAELSHGDVLYIPSEYRYSVYYSTISFGLILAAPPKSIVRKLRSTYNQMIINPLERFASFTMGKVWQRRKVRKAVRRSKL